VWVWWRGNIGADLDTELPEAVHDEPQHGARIGGVDGQMFRALPAPVAATDNRSAFSVVARRRWI